jgi:diguanylate cyclase (GGDEF)-like protein/PAS domain S-box-containing protein
MTWQAVAILNAVIATAYLVIFWLILRGLWRTQQVTSNVLGLATAMIFFTCGVHHGSHALHLVAPMFGLDEVRGLALRQAFGWQMVVWDGVGAVVAIFYLSLRRSYGRLLRSPQMFEDADRREYEERLERERASLAEAQAITHLGSWERDLATGVRTWSDEMFRIMGIAPEGEMAHMLDLVVEEDRADLEAALEATRATGAELDRTFRIRREDDGQVRFLHIRGRLVRDDRGVPRRLAGTTQDITDRHLAEVARREAEARFRITVDHAPIGVALAELAVGTPGRLLSANRPFCDLLGLGDGSLDGALLGSLLHPDDAATLLQDLQLLAIDPRARTEAHVRCLHAEGHLVWASLIGAAVPGDMSPRYAVFHLMDIGERKRFEGQLQHLADHDSLTGLFNRRRFDEELTRALAHAARYGEHGAMLMLDLDGFKYVNDTMGHSYGDELVGRIARLLRETLRATDLLARLGGDEFGIVLRHVDEREAVAVAQKLLGALRERAIALSDHRHARVTGSIGIATFDGSGGVTAEELAVEADLAMYEAKELGKDRAGVFRRDEHPRERLTLQTSWLARLRTAIADGRFELMAQPIAGICARGGDRWELLLRLRGDDGELMAPAAFLPVAERFDLIQDIDRWVFERAARMVSAHTAAGRDVCLSVNFSGKTMSDPAILEDISAILARYPIPDGALVVEVTETAAIVNIDRARDVARGLRELGCGFALDDFGAGFASFYYLKHLTFDYLKIDGEFVKNLDVNATDRLVVRSLVQIAGGLGVQTIAEFVGSDAVVERLHELDVDFGQGYHLGMPRPVQEVLPALVDLR